MKLLGRRAECEALDRLVVDALAGRSGVLVLRGEAGVGKTALLGYLSEGVTAWHKATAVGVESEMELAYGSLYQLCAPMLDRLGRLPPPQRQALSTVFGRTAGPPPDKFLVGLATLTLFSEMAEENAFICVVDDAQWLDQVSAQVLGFVCRRLLAERALVVFAARTGLGDEVLTGLPEMEVHGLSDRDARALLVGSVHGPLDAAVRDQIVMESHGNPLALLELPHALAPSELAGGFGLPEGHLVAGKVEQSYLRRLRELPSETQLLVAAAAAEPLGSPELLHRAAQTLALDMDAARPAMDSGLLKVGTRVEFAHPLLRSAAYRAAPEADRHRVHAALAEATDPNTDPDRRAWHRARAIAGPDEEVAAELERSAGRAQSRGGVVAAAAFLQRAAALTQDARRRVNRGLTAAQVSVQAGSFDAALDLLATTDDESLDELQVAIVELLRGQIAFASSMGSAAPTLLLKAAQRLERLQVELARETYLDAWGAAMFAGRFATDGDLLDVSRAARSALPLADSSRPSDLLLDSLAHLVTEGVGASAEKLQRASREFLDDPPPIEENFRWGWMTTIPSNVLWDEATWHAVTTRQVKEARDAGALARLPIDLTALAVIDAWHGDFGAAAAAITEAESITEATGTGFAPYAGLLLTALRGQEDDASRTIESMIRGAEISGQGIGLQWAEWVNAILFNGLGRYEQALPPAQRAVAEMPRLFISSWALPELIEAAARTGRTELAPRALEALDEVAAAAGTDWVLGVQARSRALVTQGSAAEALYQEAIDLLGSTRMLPELARSHLLYGEWLRRLGRRVDSRGQLRIAHGMFIEIGMEAFSERARRELVATGEKVRKRIDETRLELTSQEHQIAMLARDGMSNSEIGGHLFISPRTVEWHLRKVFTKLGIGSRRQLRAVLSEKGRLVSHP